MADPKEKRGKPAIPVREPQKRTKAGTFDNLRELPHPVEELLGLTPFIDFPARTEKAPAQPVDPKAPDAITLSTPPTPSRGASTSTPSSPGDSKVNIAPTKDFTRVPNSLAREAVPLGLFTGKSKQLYDFLYAQTRGAMVPKRSARIPKDKLMQGADIGSGVTLRNNLVKLQSIGLIEIKEMGGTHGGNEYTVYLPEEVGIMIIETPSTPSSPPNPLYPPYPLQKLEGLPPLETRGGRGGISSLKSGVSSDANTCINTYDDDDDGINEFSAVLREAASEILGGQLPKSEVEKGRWRECAMVLAEELKQAVARAGGVSSVPAFLAAHLRRRFRSGQAERRQAAEPPKRHEQAAAGETNLQKLVRELRSLHEGDPGYEKQDLIDDLRYRCEREGITWDEELALRLVAD